VGNLKSGPPAKPVTSVDDFLGGAEKRTTGEDDLEKCSEIIEHPWLDPAVRDDVFKLYNLRLPESYFLKLKFIGENGSDSMQKFCRDVLFEAIDQKIDELK